MVRFYDNSHLVFSPIEMSFICRHCHQREDLNDDMTMKVLDEVADEFKRKHLHCMKPLMVVLS